MTGAGAARLVVDADLVVSVTDPQGRSAQVVVDDHDGALRVRVARAADLSVLLASAPGARALPRGLPAASWSAVRPGPRWDQDVELCLGQRPVLRRRSGRWRPTAVTVVPAVLAAVAALSAVGVVVAAVASAVRLLRGSRSDPDLG